MEIDDSHRLIPRQQYQHRLEYKAMSLFFTIENHTSQCMYFQNT